MSGTMASGVRQLWFWFGLCCCPALLAAGLSVTYNPPSVYLEPLRPWIWYLLGLVLPVCGGGVWLVRARQGVVGVENGPASPRQALVLSAGSAVVGGVLGMGAVGLVLGESAGLLGGVGIGLWLGGGEWKRAQRRWIKPALPGYGLWAACKASLAPAIGAGFVAVPVAASVYGKYNGISAMVSAPLVVLGGCGLFFTGLELLQRLLKRWPAVGPVPSAALGIWGGVYLNAILILYICLGEILAAGRLFVWFWPASAPAELDGRVVAWTPGLMLGVYWGTLVALIGGLGIGMKAVLNAGLRASLSTWVRARVK